MRATYYFDSSALVKLYIFESGSHWVRQLIEAPEEAATSVISSKLSVIETIGAFLKRWRQGAISETLKRRLVSRFLLDTERRYILTTPTDDMLTIAIDLLQRHPLRAYDAVQLATALLINGQMQAAQPRGAVLTFVSADSLLCQAARSERLAAENPNNH